MPPIATDVTVAWSVCLSVCPFGRLSYSRTLHAKAVRRNEMLFDRDTRLAPSNIVLDRDLGTPREGEI